MLHHVQKATQWPHLPPLLSAKHSHGRLLEGARNSIGDPWISSPSTHCIGDFLQALPWVERHIHVWNPSEIRWPY